MQYPVQNKMVLKHEDVVNYLNNCAKVLFLEERIQMSLLAKGTLSMGKMKGGNRSESAGHRVDNSGLLKRETSLED